MLIQDINKDYKYKYRKYIKRKKKDYKIIRRNYSKFHTPKIISTKTIYEPAYKEKYYNFLKSPFWKKARERILRKSHICCICFTENDLNIHHISYENVFAAKPEKFYKTDIVVVCKYHHEEFHKKYGTKRIMRNEWHKFYKSEKSKFNLVKDEFLSNRSEEQEKLDFIKNI
jgi:hypothetical protein